MRNWFSRARHDVPPVSRQRHYENVCVLHAVQALYGAITPEMLAITMDTDEARDEIHLHIAASTPIDQDELADIGSELNALVGWETDVYVDQWVGKEWSRDWPHCMARPIYAARVYHPEGDE